mmetsp:Transcript_16110/g.54020  ORF Transcript_16110/g.54020 Transcript_16110/m.54020 type:complete len:102 (-) Transcript_16110:751-1056(-)
MKNIGYVAWSVGNASLCLVLCIQDELAKLFTINPIDSSKNDKRRKVPPRIADVGQFLGPSIQSSTCGLPFAQPPAEIVSSDMMQRVSNGKSGDAAEDLPSM